MDEPPLVGEGCSKSGTVSGYTCSLFPHILGIMQAFAVVWVSALEPPLVAQVVEYLLYAPEPTRPPLSATRAMPG